MRRLFLLLVVVFAVNITFNACKSEKTEEKKEQISSESKEEVKTIKYQCPMKCEKEKTYDKEGKCPVCEMKLRKKDHKKE